MTPRLELREITKRFGSVLANDAVDLAVAPGEIHALLGENGAGKSTLVKIIYGVLHADKGTMQVDGRPVRVADPNAARALGIGMVFQHFSLFDSMTVLENIALGVAAERDLRTLATRTREVSAAYGLPLDPGRRVHTLSVGERQRIEIVRCLLQRPRLLIMDEPTSVLTPQEVGRLFSTLRQLAAEGCSILYISHKLEEIRALCEAATILRGGRVVASCDPRGESARGIAQLMIGAELRTPVRRAAGRRGPARFAVEGLEQPAAGPHGTALRGIGFEVRGGEILGIAGVAGNGQSELMLALSGERPASDDAMIRLDGRPVGRSDAARRRELGLATVPEERNGHAAVPEMSLVENGLLSGHRRVGLLRRGFLRLRRARAFAGRVVREYDVRAAGVEAAARSLSGGNLQKFVVGREILQEPGVLVVAQPTWGVDAGAAAAIHEALMALAGRGAAVVVVSQDLDELLAITDRIAVINLGALSAALPTTGADVEELGLLMGGMHGSPEGDGRAEGLADVA